MDTDRLESDLTQKLVNSFVLVMLDKETIERGLRLWKQSIYEEIDDIRRTRTAEELLGKAAGEEIDANIKTTLEIARKIENRFRQLLKVK